MVSYRTMNKRIQSLDLLRGFALLGILIMNIISFSNVGVGYINPTAGAGIEGINGWIHGISHLFADTRFMSIFSILFGAGIILFSGNLEKKGLSAGRYFYPRMFWLLLFGLAHAYLIWSGDILVAYAICGCFAFLVLKWSNRSLYILGSILFCIPFLMNFLNYLFTPIAELNEQFEAFFIPTAERIARETNAYLSSYLGQMDYRMMAAMELQTFVFAIETFWRALSMMILGMILYRGGILSGTASTSTYRKMVIGGLGSGLVISGYGLYQSYAHEWSAGYVMSMGSALTYISSILVAMGYIGVVMIWSKSDWANGLKNRLMAAGRMAFTNYIGMSVICIFIFYGHGLGLFGTMNRAEQWIIVLVIWALILILSPWYLARFGQGPLEKLWRRLTFL